MLLQLLMLLLGALCPNLLTRSAVLDGTQGPSEQQGPWEGVYAGGKHGTQTQGEKWI